MLEDINPAHVQGNPILLCSSEKSCLTFFCSVKKHRQDGVFAFSSHSSEKPQIIAMTLLMPPAVNGTVKIILLRRAETLTSGENRVKSRKVLF